MRNGAKNRCQLGSSVQDFNAGCISNNMTYQMYMCTCSKGFVYVADSETCVLATDPCLDTSGCPNLKSGSNCCQAYGDKTAVCSAATDGNPYKCTCSSSAYIFDTGNYRLGCQATDSAGRDYTKICPHTEFINDPASTCLYVDNNALLSTVSGASVTGLAPWTNTSANLILQTYSVQITQYPFYVQAT
eukprot:SM000741S21892  [mRNA]  locus=s741:698:2172:+ [translate_table: standard]